jgi:hypothetical protein
VQPARFVHWTYRKYGTFIIQRVRKDGHPGTSLPCVICRKTLDKIRIPWMAHIEDVWVKSTDAHVPPSKPTNKQKNIFSKGLKL